MLRDLALFAGVVAIIWLVARYRRSRIQTRRVFIHEYTFPKGLLDKLGERYPHLTDADLHQVARGLKQFFAAYAHFGKFVSMPSQAADSLWHEFILYTRDYDAFCRRAFGHFLHHTPAVVLGTGQQNNQGLHRIWQEACRQEAIDPAKPSRLPLLFALDGMLKIPGGFLYHPQCDQLHRAAADGTPIYCAGDFSGDSSSTGGDGGHNDSDSGGDSGSGCGGGSGGGD